MAENCDVSWTACVPRESTLLGETGWSSTELQQRADEIREMHNPAPVPPQDPPEPTLWEQVTAWLSEPILPWVLLGVCLLVMATFVTVRGFRRSRAVYSRFRTPKRQQLHP